LNFWSSLTWFISVDYWAAQIQVPKGTPSILKSLPFQYFASHLPLSAPKIIDFPLSPVFNRHLFLFLPNTPFPDSSKKVYEANMIREGYDQQHDSTSHWIYFFLIYFPHTGRGGGGGVHQTPKPNPKIYDIH